MEASTSRIENPAGSGPQRTGLPSPALEEWNQDKLLLPVKSSVAIGETDDFSRQGWEEEEEELLAFRGTFPLSCWVRFRFKQC